MHDDEFDYDDEFGRLAKLMPLLEGIDIHWLSATESHPEGWLCKLRPLDPRRRHVARIGSSALESIHRAIQDFETGSAP